MNALRWQRMKGLYFNALELEDDSRPGFLAEACGEDQELRAEVERLLQAQGRLGSFLEHPEAGSLSRARQTVPDGPLRQLDDFELLEEIGCGAMGRVFRAHQGSLDRTVAVKVMQPGLTLSTRQVEQFRLEATSAAKLRHPNIVSVHSVGEVGGVHYYAMDFIDGPSLAQVLEGLREERDRGDGPWHECFLGGTSIGFAARVAQVVAELAEALQYSHEKRVLHRDVKPANVLMDRAGRPQLTDFGLAKDLELESLYHSGRVAGTPFYMSPEQARSNTLRVDHRSDIFSLGVVLYELLTLERPFEGETSHEVFRAIQHAQPQRIRRLNPKVPVDLETICAKAVEKEPSRRYATARDMAQDLRRFLSHESILAKPPSFGLKLARRVQRHRQRITAVTMTVLALVVGAKVSEWWGEREVRAAGPMGDPPSDANLKQLSAGLAELRVYRELFPDDPMYAVQEARLVERVEETARTASRQGARRIMDALELEGGELGAQINEILAGIEEFRAGGLHLSPSEAFVPLEAFGAVWPRVAVDFGDEPVPQLSLAQVDSFTGQVGPFEAVALDDDGTFSSKLGSFRLRAAWPMGFAERDLVLDLLATRVEVALRLVPREQALDGMVLLPEGEFTFGSGDENGTQGFHEQRVHLPAFWIDRYEVTNAQYRRFVEDTGYRPLPIHWQPDGYDEAWDELPVTGINHAGAEAYAAWAGKRLPSVYEWQRAARGRDGWLFPWAAESSVAEVQLLSNAGHHGDPERSHDKMDNFRLMRDAYLRGVAPVGSFSGDVTPEGVYDLFGNVWEWTSTLNLTSGKGEGFTPDPHARMRMGSSYRGDAAYDLATAVLAPLGVNETSAGFRCARSVAP